MGNPKRQHFIPRSYLKYFAEKREGQFVVDTLMKGAGSQVITLPIQSVCVQKNLYTFPLHAQGDRFALEKFYAVEVDAIYPEVYNMLSNPNITVIGKDEKHKILNTILSLFFRTPRFLNYRMEQVDRIFDEIASTVSNPEQEITIGLRKGDQIKFKLKDLENTRHERKRKIKEEFLISHFGEWQDFVNYKMDCEMGVISVTDELRIITSDNPVVIMNMDGELNMENVFYRDNIIEVPIDRNTYLVIYPNSVEENARLRITRSKRDKYFSAGVNRSTERNSDIQLVSYPGDLSSHFDLQQSLGEWNDQNMNAFSELLNKTTLAIELTNIIKKNKTAICQEVAEKVREIRKTKLLDDDEMFNKLIIALAKSGFLTG